MYGTNRTFSVIKSLWRHSSSKHKNLMCLFKKRLMNNALKLLINYDYPNFDQKHAKCPDLFIEIILN